MLGDIAYDRANGNGVRFYYNSHTLLYSFWLVMCNWVKVLLQYIYINTVII